MTIIDRLRLGVLSLFGGMIPASETPSDTEALIDGLKESLKKSDKERLLEDRRRIERDLRITIGRVKQELK